MGAAGACSPARASYIQPTARNPQARDGTRRNALMPAITSSATMRGRPAAPAPRVRRAASRCRSAEQQERDRERDQRVRDEQQREAPGPPLRRPRSAWRRDQILLGLAANPHRQRGTQHNQRDRDRQRLGRQEPPDRSDHGASRGRGRNRRVTDGPSVARETDQRFYARVRGTKPPGSLPRTVVAAVPVAKCGHWPQARTGGADGEPRPATLDRTAGGPASRASISLHAERRVSLTPTPWSRPPRIPARAGIERRAQAGHRERRAQVALVELEHAWNATDLLRSQTVGAQGSSRSRRDSTWTVRAPDASRRRTPAHPGPAAPRAAKAGSRPARAPCRDGSASPGR